MKKQMEFLQLEHTQMDDTIQKVMQREFPLPEQVKKAQAEAFSKVRASQEQKSMPELQQSAKKTAEKKTTHKKQHFFFKACAGFAAAAAVFSGVCITNPAFAAQIPLLGHVFEKLGESLGFSGDFQKYAKVENINSQTANGMTVTLSEVYCNDAALYVSLVIESEDTFPETMNFQDSDTPLINLYDSTLKFSYSEREEQLFGVANALDGKMVDEHTYAGVLRYDLSYSNTFMKEEEYDKDRTEFLESMGITQDEIEHSPEEAEAKLKDLLGVEEITDGAIAEAGGPDWNNYQETIEIPEQFTVEFHIPQISGLKPDGKLPEMPEDLRAEYEQAMRDNGLGLTDEDYANFTEEQKEIEHQLFTKMNNAYDERYPDTWEQPNQYENWWVDGPWDFTFDVTKDHSQTIVEEINDVDENGLGLVSVTKTPFELTIDDGNGADYFTVVLDADGNILDSGKFGGDTNVLAIGGRDISHIDIYICDYVEYMDELKGYYWSDDYDEKKKTKSFKQLLDERALYHRKMTFKK